LLLQHDHLDWENQTLDLRRLRLDMLVPDLVELVSLVQHEAAALDAALPVSPKGGGGSAVSFDLFSKLVRKCLRQRDPSSAGGTLQWRRNFVVTPRSRRATAQAAEPETDEETFKPQIDAHSQALAASKNRKSGAPVHEVLFEEGKKLIQRKQEALAANDEKLANREKTRPRMFAPPRTVVPRYRHAKPPAAAAAAAEEQGVKKKKVARRDEIPAPSAHPAAAHFHGQLAFPPPPPLPLPLPQHQQHQREGKGRAILPPPLPCEVLPAAKADEALRRQLFTPE
jgi:hypothetical protein